MRSRSPKREGMEHFRRRQIEITAARSGHQCEFEIAYDAVTLGETHVRPFNRPPQPIVEREQNGTVWARCSEIRGLVGCHVFRRWKNGLHETADGTPLLFHPDAIVVGCSDCHRSFDSRLHRNEVRVPRERVEAAREIIQQTLVEAKHRGEPVGEVDLTEL